RGRGCGPRRPTAHREDGRLRRQIDSVVVAGDVDLSESDDPRVGLTDVETGGEGGLRDIDRAVGAGPDGPVRRLGVEVGVPVVGVQDVGGRAVVDCPPPAGSPGAVGAAAGRIVIHDGDPDARTVAVVEIQLHRDQASVDQWTPPVVRWASGVVSMTVLLGARRAPAAADTSGPAAIPGPTRELVPPAEFGPTPCEACTLGGWPKAPGTSGAPAGGAGVAAAAPAPAAPAATAP